jgi:hypothetical protein
MYNLRTQFEQGGAVKQAQGLAALGRGEDTQLIHMTPSEIQNLQTLAQKYGGGLTVNPNTGLPEAGFLKNIIPYVSRWGFSSCNGWCVTFVCKPVDNRRGNGTWWVSCIWR